MAKRINKDALIIILIVIVSHTAHHYCVFIQSVNIHSIAHKDIKDPFIRFERA